MITVDKVVFQGANFLRYPDSGYYGARHYYRGKLNGRLQYLHRAIWESVNGPIPEGHSIHHEDHNTLNNDLSNLVCMPSREHLAHHGKLQEMTEEHLQRLARIRPLAFAWHRSPDGHESHVRLGKLLWTKKKPSDYVCVQCGKPFQSTSTRKAMYCSDACLSKFRRVNGLDDEDRICLWCGEVFRTCKHGIAKCCSDICAQRYRRQIFEGGKSGRRNKKAAM